MLEKTDNLNVNFTTNQFSHLLAPVHTIFPELKTSAVVLGSRILIMTAAKRYKTKEIIVPTASYCSIENESALK